MVSRESYCTICFMCIFSIFWLMYSSVNIAHELKEIAASQGSTLNCFLLENEKNRLLENTHYMYFLAINLSNITNLFQSTQIPFYV